MKSESDESCHCILEMIVELRVVRKRMGVLFWTMPWYSSKEMSFWVTESRCACILIFRTSWWDGSVSCILRKIMVLLISWIVARITYLVSLSVILSSMAGWGLLKIISFGVSSMRAVNSAENWDIAWVSTWTSDYGRGLTYSRASLSPIGCLRVIYKSYTATSIYIAAQFRVKGDGHLILAWNSSFGPWEPTQVWGTTWTRWSNSCWRPRIEYIDRGKYKWNYCGPKNPACCLGP